MKKYLNLNFNIFHGHERYDLVYLYISAFS